MSQSLEIRHVSYFGMDFDQIIAFRAEVALSSYSSSVASSHTRLLST